MYGVGLYSITYLIPHLWSPLWKMIRSPLELRARPDTCPSCSSASGQSDTSTRWAPAHTHTHNHRLTHTATHPIQWHEFCMWTLYELNFSGKWGIHVVCWVLSNFTLYVYNVMSSIRAVYFLYCKLCSRAARTHSVAWLTNKWTRVIQSEQSFTEQTNRRGQYIFQRARQVWTAFFP